MIYFETKYCALIMKQVLHEVHTNIQSKLVFSLLLLAFLQENCLWN